MVGCAATGCSNRAEKGFSMKTFPRDPVLRNSWALNVNRQGWTPSNYSKLCEVHFSPEMWEKPRVDGKRKLRWNAVPTIFNFSTRIPQQRKIHSNRITEAVFIRSNALAADNQKVNDPLSDMDLVKQELTDSSESNRENITEVKYFATNENLESSNYSKSLLEQRLTTNNSEKISELEQTSTQLIIKLENPTTFHCYAQLPSDAVQKIVNPNNSTQNISSESDSTTDDSDTVSDIEEPAQANNQQLVNKLVQYEKTYRKILAKKRKYEKEIRTLKTQNKKLESSVKLDKNLVLLKRVFNDDQIRALNRTNARFMKWSQNTLVNALRLKNYCGNDGYEEILRQKLPFPSIRTINRVKLTETIPGSSQNNNTSENTNNGTDIEN